MNSAPLWTAAGVLDAVSGNCASRDWTVTGISIDSRTVAEGDLFIAIVGPNNDGHAYLAKAFDQGAVAALVSRVPENCPDALNLILVADTQLAMEQLGMAARARTHARIIAVTGSVGKTGTKEALAHVLKAQGRTHYSVGSYNNHWGVPLSLARMPQDTEFAIFELGMNHAGELRVLSKMVRAHVALITTIAVAHLEFFDSIDDIATAKSEIFEGLEEGGMALLNADDGYCEFLSKKALAAGVGRVATFGEAKQADICLQGVLLLPQLSEISVTVFGHNLTFTLSVPGRHWVQNSLAVLGAVYAVGADVGAAAQALGSMAPPSGRGGLISVPCEGGAFEIVDESYNASPIAMQAAFKVLSAMNRRNSGRKIMVLGDMRELGEKSTEIHASLANDISASDVDMVYACGPNMWHLYEALPHNLKAGYADNSDELAGIVAGNIRAEDVILVKGSLGSKMKVILDMLLVSAGDQNAVKKQEGK